MSITVGTDTYATLAEATTYIGQLYLSTDAKRTAWEALTEADQEVYMRRATKQVDKNRFQGIKAVADQTLEFPRYFYRDALRIDYDEVADVETTEVPDDVKHAQIEEALELVTPGEDTDERALRNGPVKSYRIGNLSEDYGSAAAQSTAAYIMNSKTAAQLLEKYINGGFRIS